MKFLKPIVLFSLTAETLYIGSNCTIRNVWFFDILLCYNICMLDILQKLNIFDFVIQIYIWKCVGTVGWPGEGGLSRLSYSQSIGLWLVHLMELWCRYVRVRYGFGGFLDLREDLFLSQNTQRLSSHRGSSFFLFGNVYICLNKIL